jgi:hypothetical protein
MCRRTKTDSPRSVQNTDRSQEVVVVSHRLAHAHEDDVVDFLAALGFDLKKLSTISPAVRFLFQPSSPLAQNLHP